MARRIPRVRYAIATLLTVVAGRAATAQVPVPESPPPDLSPAISPAQQPTPIYAAYVPPSHLGIGNQQFDASVDGIRHYLESIKSKNLGLYTKLEPRLEHLEDERTASRIVLATGIGVGLASGIYGIAGRKDCPGPAVTDPNFAADTAAWAACNDDNMHTTTKFTLIGFGAVAAGFIGWAALAPGRSELFDFVNEHNRLNAEPLRLQLGYDPTRQFAYGGASLRF